MDMWAATLLESDPDNPQQKTPPFRSAKHLYDVIDSMPLVGTKWSRLSIKYSDFKDSFNYVPYREFHVDNNERQYQDFMSGDWAWVHVHQQNQMGLASPVQAPQVPTGPQHLPNTVDMQIRPRDSCNALGIA
ncbi:hypothetical protein BS17DRAFT_766773 [Gyrodon lividus]|nr:hypothetical protein BS17DRAFT_766773 [Gyrodon lividus]